MSLERLFPSFKTRHKVQEVCSRQYDEGRYSFLSLSVVYPLNYPEQFPSAG